MRQKDGRKIEVKWAGLTPPLHAGAALWAFFVFNAKNGIKNDRLKMKNQ